MKKTPDRSAKRYARRAQYAGPLFCHNSDTAKLGAEHLLNRNDYFTKEERAGFVPDFLADGIVDEKLVVFPVSKSTHVLYISDREFSRFLCGNRRVLR